jgi:hypothetical protein
MKNYEDLLLKTGMILTPSSGRNLGPVSYVGRYLAKFAMTDVMRIVPTSPADGFYLLAYLLTSTAQMLIQRGRSGTTVDHLAPDDVLNLEVPWIESESWRESVIADVRKAEGMLDEGRSGLDQATAAFHAQLNLELEPPRGNYLSTDCGETFAVSSSKLGMRLDAASHDPTASLCSARISEVGGIELGQVADLNTLERYIRYYVEPPFGRPVLSGRQMLQLRPVNLRRISDRSFADPKRFALRAGSTVFTCDGRSEEALGEPAYVIPAWDGWLASEHVMRVEPRPEIGHGYLYLALSSPWVQRQLKARATGSVIDALEPEEIEGIVIPLMPDPERRALDHEAKRCWGLISDSVVLTEKTARRFELKLKELSAG